MEDFIAFLEFKDGVLSNGEPITNPMVDTVKSIVEPIIFQRELSGKIRIESYHNKLSVGYDSVKPFEYVRELMQAINSSSSSEDFG
ncbi:MAG TPA: hypothetical protein VK772_11750 [Puia sp.]|jgi:hypothetical protein|nr:hypothetical protein [Puia sp.]